MAMDPLKGLSRKEIGIANVEALAKYLNTLRSEGMGLPARGDKASPSAVALACGFDRQTLYANPKCREMYEKALQELGLQGIAGQVAPRFDDGKERRIQRLESENASLRAEVQGLRKQLQRYAHLQAHLIESGGRRVIP